MKEGPSAIRVLTAILGLASSGVSALHAYRFSGIESPTSAVALMAVVALLKMTTSVSFGLAPGRKRDVWFVFLFGVCSLEDVSRFLSTPFESLLITPAALFAGGIALWTERMRKRSSPGAA